MYRHSEWTKTWCKSETIYLEEENMWEHFCILHEKDVLKARKQTKTKPNSLDINAYTQWNIPPKRSERWVFEGQVLCLTELWIMR